MVSMHSSFSSLMANALRAHRAGHLDEAKRIYLQILAIDVRHAETLHLLGIVEYQLGRYESAAKMIARAIAIDGKQAGYHFNLGLILQMQGKLSEAVDSYGRALVLQPNYAEVCYNRGNALRDLGKPNEASESFRRAVTLKADYLEAWNNLGLVLKSQNKLDEAVDCFERVLALDERSAEGHHNLGEVRYAQGLPGDAAAHQEQALALKPDYVEALVSLGAAYELQGRLEEAVTSFEKALALNPENAAARLNLAMVQLLQENFASGLQNYEVRTLCENAPRRFFQPQWRGEPLEGARILLHHEQGLGDTIQFLRFVPLVRAAGGVVVLELPPRLRRIAARFSDIAELVDTGKPLPRFDFHCPFMSLPLAFGMDRQSIPAQVPYLSVPGEAMESAGALPWPSEGLRVGIVWSGSPEHARNSFRSIPFELLDPIFDVAGAQFFSLQMGAAAARLAQTSAAITDLGAVTGDMADTAAQIAHLDLIITVDTSVAHLAGALAAPTWLLLSSAPDWRWFERGEESPWYPTMRLFRQSNFGDWQAVIERVCMQLRILAAGNGGLEHSRSTC